MINPLYLIDLIFNFTPKIFDRRNFEEITVHINFGDYQ